MRSLGPSLLLFVIFIAAASRLGAADEMAPPLLDFWTGEWVVYSLTGEEIGTNRIEKTLGGRAVIEHWRDRKGREGKSLFYHHTLEGRWKQVWVSDEGIIKEKAAVGAPVGNVRFLGRQRSAAGAKVWLDRTTLKLLEAGTVEQLIEVSTDDGENWRPVFTGIYRRKASAAHELPMNKINWFQIPAGDLARATKFYTATLGWQFYLQDDQMGRHAFILADKGGVTGEIVQNDYAKASPDGTRLFLSTPDGVAETVARITAAGGKIVMPATSIGPMGVIAIFMDSEGNQVGLHGLK